ncbi:putative artemis protein [Rosellinia necatrix]|uniref:Putative artemis protein n=1 Tax=Rosellinia necatrix TaxID=77044 RepID=A0A1W2TJN1_ROSNE|nr:putative artemis protein [Rosellinia necatrix]
MSTFKGFLPEFPDIRVDFFRRSPGLSPPLACFLSHVHSDHLAGLDTFDGSFIYCSAATKEILLRLERSSVRLNLANGIFEDPRLQTYKHLEKKLKPIPLDTPTTISLSQGSSIQVTLLDANHCVGAVMFLFESSGKAVLYTGDIRCEPRFVTAITQNPNMIEYSSGWKTLDRIYLDTSILDNYPLQTKADGLRELLGKLRRYPEDTIFHFQAWTYGYEEVWIALSKALNSKIHVDDYKMRVFESLVTKSKDNRWATQTHLSKEAPALVGFTCGNTSHAGCLTRDENVRIHSCGKGMGCKVMETKPIVWIRPIVTHLKGGQDLMEVGIGGGGEDLAQATTLTPNEMMNILELISTNNTLFMELRPYLDSVDTALKNGRDISLTTNCGDPVEEGVPGVMKLLLRKLESTRNPIMQRNETLADDAPLPNVIYFPYARHSSLPELRNFVGAFKPKDITPCTFDPERWLQKGWSVGGLFGDCCSGDKFEFDDQIFDYNVKEPTTGQDEDSQQTTSSASFEPSLFRPPTETAHAPDASVVTSNEPARSQAATSLKPRVSSPISEGLKEPRKRKYDSFQEDTDRDDTPDLQGDSQASAISNRTYSARKRAFDVATSNMFSEQWDVIGLISTTDNHTTLDEELGQP